MKIILSHDVDHLFWSEHYFSDLFVPAFLARNIKGALRGRLNPSLFRHRFKTFGRMHQLDYLIDFYNQENIKASFFFGMDQALGLSYNPEKAGPLMNQLHNLGHEVGVHGIEAKNFGKMEVESNMFSSLTGIKAFGIRMHYLRLTGYSFDAFEKLGYLFDSSVQGLKPPFQFGKLWEFPISIMDASFIDNFQFSHSLKDWKAKTLTYLNEANRLNLPYFVINVHDVYLSNAYPTVRAWFEFMVDHLIQNKYEFITFQGALNELNSGVQK